MTESTQEPELPDTHEYINIISSDDVALDGWFSYDDLPKIVKYVEWLKENEADGK